MTAGHLSCFETIQRLDLYLDRALGEDERRQVEQHLEECVHCAQIYAFEGKVLIEVREKLQRVDVPPMLRLQVLNLLARERGG